jgi:hypothetical protein
MEQRQTAGAGDDLLLNMTAARMKIAAFTAFFYCNGPE